LLREDRKEVEQKRGENQEGGKVLNLFASK